MTNELHLIDPADESTFMTNPYPDNFEKVNYAFGESKGGTVEIAHLTVPDDNSTAMYNLRQIRDLDMHRIVPPGEYTRLIVGGQFMMSDTPAEAWEHEDAYERAEGNVLVNGLGLGFYLDAIQRKPEVENITVVEISEGVIELIGPHFPDVEIIHGNALKVDHDEEFDFAWHDIWPTISDDNIPAMIMLTDRYGGSSWGYDMIMEKIDEGYF